MPCCILNPIDLCKIPACAELFDTDQIATEPGTWKLVLQFLGAEYSIEQDFDEDEALIFLITKPLNESQQYLAQIKKPDDSVFTFGDPEHDGFKFETVISL